MTWTLWRAKIRAFEDLAAMTEKQLLRVPGIGVKRVAEIKQAMAEHGFSLRGT